MRISPSKLQAWQTCPCFEYATDNKTAGEGTLLHAAAATESPKGLDTEDLVDQYEKMIQYKTSLRTAWVGEIVLEFTELRVEMCGIKGSLDWAIYNPAREEAHVIDWKTGRLGLPSTAQDNVQLRAYGRGFFNYCEKEKHPLKKVTVHLVAPRTNEADTFEYHATDGMQTDALIMGIVAAVEDPFKRPSNTSPDLCGNCAHASRCPALNAALLPVPQEVTAIALPGIFKPVDQMSPEDISKFFAFRGLLEEWIDQRKSALNQRIAAENLEIPGYGRRTRAGGYKIENQAAVIDVLRSILPDAEFIECLSVKSAAIKTIRPEVRAALEPYLVKQPDTTFLTKTRKVDERQLLIGVAT